MLYYLYINYKDTPVQTQSIESVQALFVEDVKTPSVEDVKAPSVEDVKTPSVEDVKTLSFEDESYISLVTVTNLNALNVASPVSAMASVSATNYLVISPSNDAQDKKASTKRKRGQIININGIEISSIDLKALNGNGWLSDNIMYGYLHIICPEKWVVLNAIETNYIFIEPEKRNSYEKAINYKLFDEISNNLKNKNTVVVLLNIKNHWKFLMISLSDSGATRDILYIDPLGNELEGTGEPTSEMQNYCKNWVQFFNSNNEYEYIINSFEHVNQNDTVNCGIFVLFFIENVTLGMTNWTDFSPNLTFFKKQRQKISKSLKNY